MDKLFDRSKIEETKAAKDGGAFYFSREWPSDKGTLEETDFSAEPELQTSPEEVSF